MITEATQYWATPTARAWEGNSHWRSGIPDQWARIGPEHLDMFRKLHRTLDRPLEMRSVVEWGAGGGANAVAFAPHADEFVAVDIVADSLAECERRTRAVCDTPVRQVLTTIDDPESALEQIGRGTCDVFLCLYVMELLPSQAYALRVLDIARQLLAPTGVAFVQIKYRDYVDRTPHRRNYARNLASQTIFPIDEFWQAAADHGFVPQAVCLVPQNDLDKHYAYLLLTPAVPT